MPRRSPSVTPRIRAPLWARVTRPIALIVVLVVALGPATALALGAGSHRSGGVGIGGPAASAPGSTSAGGGKAAGGTTAKPGPAPKAHRAAPNPFAHRAMWIWELGSSFGGNISKIIFAAKVNGVRTLIIKSGDGSSSWSQFSPTLVRRLHAAGLKVCGWQYVYGIHPTPEAHVGAAAVADGADCLVIDAESQYEGRYVQAQTYLTALRKQIGQRFPVALAGFPYVDYHPSFPYSVFLGRGGAQYNTPQMYWQDIGVSVPTVYSHTYQWNTLYRRSIYPLGQMFNHPPVSQIKQFNEYAKLYGARGVSWWVWQSATIAELATVAKLAARPRSFVPNRTPVTIARGKRGDFVVWAQEHLAAWAARNETGSLASLAVDGDFGPATQSVLAAFQTARGLPASGRLDAATWNRLLSVKPVAVRWVKAKKGGLSATIARASIARSGGVEHLAVPASAHLHGRSELHGASGSGGHSS